MQPAFLRIALDGSRCAPEATELNLAVGKLKDELNFNP